MTSSCTAAKSNTEHTNRIQNQAMDMATGAISSTQVSALETATGLQSLEDRICVKVRAQAAKFKRLIYHTVHSRMNKQKGSLKRSSFIYHSRILERQQPELLDHMPEPIQIHAAVPCRERQMFPTIFTHIQGIKRKAASQTLTEDPLHWSTLVPTTQRRIEHRSALMDLPLKLPGMEVDGSTSNIEQKKHTELRC